MLCGNMIVLPENHLSRSYTLFPLPQRRRGEICLEVLYVTSRRHRGGQRDLAKSRVSSTLRYY